MTKLYLHDSMLMFIDILVCLIDNMTKFYLSL